LAQVTVFQATPDWSDLGGGLLILAAVLGMSLEQGILRRCNCRWM
jgi:hypothetical protein